MRELELPTVTRVHTGRGSYVEPPLEQAWSDDEKLAWHAAVVAHDTGLTVRVFEGGHQVRRFGVWRDVPGSYSISASGHSTASYSYRDAWTWLNGFDAGVFAARRDAAVTPDA